jgi:phage N-6-adenine-methyltransferase
MQGQDVLFSSASVEWGTPWYIFNALDDEFHFTLDAAASPANAKCAQWFGLQPDGTFIDGLKQDWQDNVVFVNPPYGNKHNLSWARKIYEEASKDVTVVGLVPARTDTRFWCRYYAYAHEIWFIEGRVKFVLDGKYNSATFPSAIVVFRGKPNDEPYKCVRLWKQPGRN